MRKIFSGIQMKQLDEATLKEENISSLKLMERAANAVVRQLAARWDANIPFLVMAGPGNNGGDALAVARMLAGKGYAVKVFLFNPQKKLSEDTETNKVLIQKTEGVDFHEITAQFEPPLISPDTVIIDGLFGTGLNKPLTGGYASLVKFLNDTGCTIVSIDMPSGLFTEDNTYNVKSNIIRATVTLTFQYLKLSLILPDTNEFAGEVKVLDIGLSKKKAEETDTPYYILEEKDIKPLLKPRNKFSHKGTYGNALLVVGKHGMMGAAVLCAKACMRSGIGKVTCHVPNNCADIMQVGIPEAVLSIDENDKCFTQSVPTDNFNSLAIGPGIGTKHETAVAVIEQVRRARIPVVIDADGLNILAEHKGWMQQVPTDTILTPHLGEMARLGTGDNSPYSSLAEAREMAKRHCVYIILKGHYTAICMPDGRTVFNATGNSGMATAGSGDVLTGIIASLLAQKYNPANACMVATHIHGLAGDIAAAKLGEESLIASDIIKHLPEAFKKIKSGNGALSEKCND